VQRPFGLIADPEATPKAIHISCFDSAPLGVDYNYTLSGDGDAFAKGLEALKVLTSGAVHLNVKANADNAAMFTQAKGVEINSFAGSHPAGLVGVQIHHLDPINKGEVVWTINPQHVVFIGRLLETGKLDLTQKVAVAGSDIKKPQYVETVVGVNIESLTTGNVSNDNARYISGNVLPVPTLVEKVT
jgi:Na+-transporting NADH:ubiquinone oxidoreductase subunit A